MFKKPDNKLLIYLGGLIIFSLFLFLIGLTIVKANSPDSPHSPPANTNISVCIDQPYPDMFKPIRKISAAYSFLPIP